MKRQQTLEWRQALTVRHEADVVVAGGGPAGIAAAVTAARQGARVFLVEAQTCLGGMGTAGMLPVFMPFGDGVHFYAGGFGREVFDRLELAGATAAERPWGRWLPLIRGEGLKRLYDDLIEEAGVVLSLATQVVAVDTEGARLRHVICAAKSGLFAVRGRVFVDGTGDGDLAAWSGAPFAKGDEEGAMMPGTLCSLWTDVDWSTANRAGQQAEEVLHRALQQDPTVLPQLDPHLPGMLPIGPTSAGGNVGHCFGVDGTDERSVTRAMVAMRRLLPYYERFYRQHMAGFERVSLAASAPHLGIRETRRILGDYVLGLEDFRSLATFDDEIGRYHYWVDLHCLRPGLQEFARHVELRSHPLKPGESYGIPYRILIPRGLDNVLVAGRCVSADRSVQASIRVMPGCYITGQAAGMAAAMAAQAETSTRAVPVRELQRRLQALGGYLPNARTSPPP